MKNKDSFIELIDIGCEFVSSSIGAFIGVAID